MSSGFDLWKTIVNKEKSENTDEDFKKQDFEPPKFKFSIIISITCIICLTIGLIVYYAKIYKVESPVCAEMYKILKSDETNYDYQTRINYVNDFYKKGYDTQCKRLELLDKNYFLARIYWDWSAYLLKYDIKNTEKNFDNKIDLYRNISKHYFNKSKAKFDYSRNSNKTTDGQYWLQLLMDLGKINKDFEKYIDKVNFYYDHCNNIRCKNNFEHLDRNYFLSEIYGNWAESISKNDINKAIELQKKAIDLTHKSRAKYFNGNNNRSLIIAPRYFNLSKYYLYNKQYNDSLVILNKAIDIFSLAGGNSDWYNSNKCKIYWAMNDEENAKIYCEYAYRTLPSLINKLGGYKEKGNEELLKEYNIVSSIYRQIINKTDCSYLSKLGWEAKKQGDYSKAQQYFIEARNCINNKCEALRTSYGLQGDIIVNSCKMENNIQVVELEIDVLRELWYYSH